MYEYIDESGCGVMDWDQFLFTHDCWEDDYEDEEEVDIIKDDFFDEK